MKVFLFFGEMGSGKSHLGRLYAEESVMPFIEGDDFAGPEMAEAIKNLRVIKPAMVDEMIQNLKEEGDRVMHNSCRSIVISQALYRESHRLELIWHWETQGHEVIPIWVTVPTVQHIRQLRSRLRGMKWLLYWLMSKPFFQSPKHPHVVWHNERTE